MAAKNSRTAELVDVLYEAHMRRQSIPKDRIPADLDKEQAYEIQRAVTEKKAAEAGEQLRGYKISLTSKETQDLFASDSPLYGAVTGPAPDRNTVSLEGLLSPLIELELIFIAQEDLSVTDDVQAILEKTHVAPGIEVPDSRFEDWFPNVSLGQVIADSAVAGTFVAGTPKAGVTYSQLERVKGTLKLDGREIASGVSTEVLGHPVHAVKWLIEELHKHGLPLKKGMAVSSGTFILPKPLERGTYTAEYEGIGAAELVVK
ncbi:2-keto-4-pentenoate hydratase [Indiicoccus explosivorum]|uniref:2-keto-4-pentenoate hydratase n=1 Tax=Indiicoccus explosivorum TaxID=1917864 RepID=UPI001F4DFF46|nr:hydratase [Indiicoccus explosivorum]